MPDDLENRQDVDDYAPAARDSFQFIQITNAQGIVRLVLNRPPANVLSIDMMDEINHALTGHDGCSYESPPQPRQQALTLARVLLLGSANTSEAARRHADLIIKPRTEGVGLLEFHQLDVAREAGRTAAREALANAPASVLGSAPVS